MKYLYDTHNGGIGMWPFRFAMGRRTKRGLPHMVMYLLSSSPKNGVELMDGVQSITRGWWRPTPGSIYPLLKEMTDQGIVRKLDDGRYELTSKGKTEAGGYFGPSTGAIQTVGEAVQQLHNTASYIQDLKRSGQASVGEHKDMLREVKKQISDLLDEDQTK
jgi:DNA-binding PadR family transcriptional regulator